ncbi:MAG: response regulator [bacterium]|nr:response regulator [bacterium]
MLVIDDDDAHRHLFVTALKQSGRYEVLEASNGEEGLEVFQQQPCDLVICDIFMPQKEGLETIFELRQYAPHVRVIAISGGGRWAQHGRSLDADEPLDMARRFGAAKTLKKPVKIQELLKIVSDLLRK